MPDGPTIPSSSSMQIVACAVCGGMFALPRGQLLAAVATAATIFCPAGHSHIPGRNNSLNLAQTMLELTAELAQERNRSAALSRQLLDMKPSDGAPVECDRKELRRRAQMIANRAKLMEFGRRECPFCGNVKGGNLLAEHLLRQHPKRIKELTPAIIESMGGTE